MGFEPTIRIAAHTAFRERRLQPLGHLSIKAALIAAAIISGALGGTRTCDLQYRKLTLYPTELRAHTVKDQQILAYSGVTANKTGLELEVATKALNGIVIALNLRQMLSQYALDAIEAIFVG